MKNSIVPLALLSLGIGALRPSADKLRLEEVGADSTAYDVTATMIIGPTEVLLWDAQYHVADANRLADRIAATGKHLKAIVLSHPDHDHFMGAAKIVERFPGTPVYISSAGLAEYQKTAARAFQGEKARRPELVPDSIVTPTALPSLRLTVDGEAIEVIPDLQGDVLAPTNSILWIPSLKAVLAADVLFNNVHPWFGASDVASRKRWLESLKRIDDLHPTVVVAGHKKNIDAPDSPDVVSTMRAYLLDFDSIRVKSASADELRAAMAQKYPAFAVPVLLFASAQTAFRKP